MGNDLCACAKQSHGQAVDGHRLFAQGVPPGQSGHFFRVGHEKQLDGGEGFAAAAVLEKFCIYRPRTNDGNVDALLI